MLRKWFTLFIVTSAIILATFVIAYGSDEYTIYRTGSSNDVNTQSQGGLVLMGGGTDVDEAIQWMIDRSGGGDFVVLRASGSDGYNSYIYSELGGVNSVTTIVINNKNGANNDSVKQYIRNAEALFIAGGDQANYVKDWNGTEVEDSISYLISNGVPVGGTSAGCAILGEHVFDAINGTVYSDEVLEDPYNQYMSFTHDFLSIPKMEDTITDTHFYDRRRMGRLVGFLARLIEDGHTSPNNTKGIGVDEATAYVMYPNGTGKIYGEGYVYFLKTTEAPSNCNSGEKLDIDNIKVYRANNNDSFNVESWTGSGGISYWIDCVNGKLSSSRRRIY